MNFLLVIIQDLLPFIRGCDLLALALTCRWLHRRIFESRRWKALRLVKDFNHKWNYGLLNITSCNFSKAIEQQDCLVKYIESNLPIEIELFNHNYNDDYQKLVETKPFWLNSVTLIDKINSAELEIMIEHGLIPENLRHVSLRGLNVSHDILGRMTRLQSLQIYKMIITSSISHFNALPNLKKLEIKSQYLDCSVLEPLNNVTSLSMELGSIQNSFALSKLKNLKELTIWAPVDDISFLEFLDELEYFDIGKHGRQSTITTKFPSNPPKKLKRLYMKNYLNGNLDFLSGWTSLEIIQIQNARILDINALQSCVNLKTLDLDMATINSLKPLAKCLNLMELSFGRCVDNDWESLIELENLQYVETRFIDNIPESFSKLKLPRLKIKIFNAYRDVKLDVTLSPKFMRQLAQLNLRYVTPTSLSFMDYATRLTSLWIYCSRIEDIQPLSQLVQLEELYLACNMIKDIHPLSGLLKLRNIDLWTNCIVDIEPLSNLLELEKLNLGFNKIRDVKPLFGLKKLFMLNLYSNNVPESELKELMRWKTVYL